MDYEDDYDEDLFSEGENKPIDKDRAEEFHSVVAQGLYICKRARPDVHQAITVLCTRVKAPNESD